MKRALLYLLLAALCGGCAGSLPPAETNAHAPEPYGPPPGYVLVVSDEFADEGAPDARLWQFDTGPWPYNDEWQCYRPQNAFVEDDCLIIEARQENAEGRTFTSARLHTRNTLDMTYGYLEIRAAFPQGIGTWAAIWLLPTDTRYGGYLESGEIDIAEHVGYQTNRVYATLHTAANNAVNGNAITAKSYLQGAADGFHVYGFLWTEDAISIQVDGNEVLRYHQPIDAQSETWPFDVPFHLLLNLAVGGSWGGMEGVNVAAFPQRMAVDYVRYYQRKDQ